MPHEETLEAQLHNAFDAAPSPEEERAVSHRFLQLARREGYVRGGKDRMLTLDADWRQWAQKHASSAYPITTTHTVPRVLRCPIGGPWVKADGTGGVDFFRDESAYEAANLCGLRPDWLPVIQDVIANPTRTETVEE